MHAFASLFDLLRELWVEMMNEGYWPGGRYGEGIVYISRVRGAFSTLRK